MISFSIDKQRGQVNVEWMSRPIDTNKKINKNQSLVLALTSMEQSPTFASRLKRKLLSGPILRGAYNMTVRGYRILSLKKLNQGQRFAYLDWIIAGVSGFFILGLLGWGGWSFLYGNNMGLVALTFSLIGIFFLVSDVKALFNPPKEKMHWWYGHISSTGGSYISAVTAFVVVNIQLTHYQWILWILPALIGGALISQTIRKYKLKKIKNNKEIQSNKW